MIECKCPSCAYPFAIGGNVSDMRLGHIVREYITADDADHIAACLRRGQGCSVVTRMLDALATELRKGAGT